MPPVQLAVKIVARLKVMARLDIAERRVPQDGRIKMRLSKNRAIDFRVSTCPTLFGEKVVTRILDPSSAMLGIDALGYEPLQRELYLKYLAKPQGMILVTGPTGSGKTVSLYTGLNILNTEDCNISTAEDPAEINLPGINQVNVNNKVGLTFASALRAFLAARSRRHHGRRNPRFGNCRDRHQGGADGTLGAVDPAHQRCAANSDALGGHGRQALCHCHLGEPHHRAALGAQAVQQLQTADRHPAGSPEERGFRAGRHRQRHSECSGPSAAANAPTATRAAWVFIRSCPSPSTIGRIIMQGGGAININDQATKDGIWNLRRSGLQKVRDGVTSLEEVNNVTID